MGWRTLPAAVSRKIFREFFRREWGAQIDLATWQVPPPFEHLQSLGNVEQDEMSRTFNIGIGLMAVIPAEKVKKARAILNRANERHCIIGRTVRGE
jgi:phosphoribosylformylglycinamidine cyclo-ligase